MPQNIAKFHIIGRVGKVETRDKVSYVDVASNYNRQRDGEWEQDTHWNHVTLFGKIAERALTEHKGCLVRITGRVRQTSFERNGATVYGVDLIADSYSVLARPAEASDDNPEE